MNRRERRARAKVMSKIPTREHELIVSLYQRQCIERALDLIEAGIEADKDMREALLNFYELTRDYHEVW